MSGSGGSPGATAPAGKRMGIREAGRPAGERSSVGGRRPAVSVVVPVVERPEPLDELYLDVAEGLAAVEGAVEYLFVAPGWRHEALSPLRELREAGEPIRLLEVAGETTEAWLLRAASERARGDVLLTLPAYYRVRADALPGLVRTVADGEADVAVARRSPRRDAWINRVQNRAFHGLLRVLVGAEVEDTGCGVRAMRPDVLGEVPLYGDFSRFLPILASREGFRVREMEAPQHERDRGSRIYPPGTYARRLIDLLGLFFLTRFTYKPLRFFGLVGSLLGGGGLAILAVVFVQRVAGQAAADRPLLVLGVLLATLGVQAVALGLVGEIVVHFNVPERPGYRVVEDSEEER